MRSAIYIDIFMSFVKFITGYYSRHVRPQGTSQKNVGMILRTFKNILNGHLV